MPLTCVLLSRLLGDITDEKKESGTEDRGAFMQRHNARLLIVDDIDINLIIARETLLYYGGDISLAYSGAQAIEMIKENDYDIVFMDHMMPDLDGVDVTKIIRAIPDEKYKKLPIIALTANVVGDVWDMFLESGMSDFLSKPLEHKELERVLREWLPQEKWINVQHSENAEKQN